MHINNRRLYFLDSLVEVTGIKSGLGVLVPEALTLLERGTPVQEAWWRGGVDEPIRIEGGVLQRTFVKLLHSVGAIGDDRDPGLMVAEFVREHSERLRPDDDDIEYFLPPELTAVGQLQNLIIGHLSEPTPLIRDLILQEEWLEIRHQYTVRNVMDTSYPESRSWDGLIDLRSLFESEEAPPDPDTYFDQRYIDYLNAQGEDLCRMHWRQFERLTAEYFRQTGYRVQLGPGRADGGIDVRASKDRIFAGPEVIIIQCKRIKECYEVEINDVKALWADVLDEVADKGIMATTTRLAAGARNYCDARRHRLQRVEADTVRRWLHQLGTGR